MTESGLLGTDHSTLALSLSHVPIRRLEPRAVYVTSCLDDLAALSSVGLEACLSDGLLKCSGLRLTSLAPKERLNKTLEDSPERMLANQIKPERRSLPIGQDTLIEMAQKNAPTLVLVDWHPVTLSRRRPAQLAELVGWLFDCYRFGKRGLSRISIWKLKPSAIHRSTRRWWIGNA